MFYFVANFQEVEVTELIVLTDLILSYSRIINFGRTHTKKGMQIT